MKLFKACIVSVLLVAGFSSQAMAKPDLNNAKKIFAQNCATCHGPAGKGDGPAAAALNPKPANFSKGVFKYGNKDADIAKLIKNGKGSMPPWGSMLKDKDINDLVGYIRTLKK